MGRDSLSSAAVDIEPETTTGTFKALWQTITRFETNKTTIGMGLRNALGVTLPLVAGVALGAPAVGLVASSGALNVSFSDGDDPYTTRARRMVATSLLVGCSVFVGSLAGQDRVLAGVVTILWAFGAAMLVALGPPAADLAVISLVTLVVFTAQPLHPAKALSIGLVALGGGLLQTALALAFWPMRRYHPERLALGELYRQLARTATEPATILTPSGTAETTHAQETLAALARDHSVPSERYLFLLSQGERIRLSLLAIARMRKRLEREDPSHVCGAVLDQSIEIYSALLESIANWLLSGYGPKPSNAESTAIQLEQLHKIAEGLTGLDPAMPVPVAALIKDTRFQMDALIGQLRAALDVANQTTVEGLADFDKREARQPWALRFAGTVATLRANLCLDSAAFRHAVRLAACIAASELLGGMLGWQRSYWMPMTIAIVLKPDFSSTFSRGVLRLAGTFVGLLLMTALFHFVPPQVKLEVVLIAVVVFILRGFGATNYGVLVAAVSALVVLLFAFSGIDPKVVIVARAWNTGAAGALALLAYAVWPTWERTRVSEAMANMLDAYFRYFQVVANAYLRAGSVSPTQLDQARLQARLARSNAEASVDRVTTEPGATGESMNLLGAMLASSHRFIHAVMALEAGLSSRRPVPARGQLRPFVHTVELTLHSVAAALRGSPLSIGDLPDLRQHHNTLIRFGTESPESYAVVNVETDRITNSLNTLAELVLQWVSGRRR
ncbi:MAG: FUSC family protein [Acidobacteriota bacterium]|nr:FUSC family protein [Acidobacteriota bacterium]